MRKLNSLIFSNNLTKVVFSVLVFSPYFHAFGNSQFLAQKVCTNKSGQILAIDPFLCPADGKLRNLAFGEPLPYRKHDQPTPGNPRGYQYSDSFVILDPVHGTHYLSTMQFADGVTLEASARQLDYNPDGYNLVSTKRDVVSFIGTKDWTGPQAFYAPGCQLSKSWELFPTSLKAGQRSQSVAQLRLLRPHQACGASTLFDKSFTEATFSVAPFRFSSGKSLQTIVATHYGAESPSATAAIKGAGYEVVYFTELYGLTRWEGWQRSQDVAGPGGNCTGTTQRTDAWGNRWTRVDCRDWTYVSNTDQKSEPISFSPHSVQLDSPFKSFNQLKNTDFFNGWDGSWRRYDGSQEIHWSIQRDLKNNRRHLAIACKEQCDGDTLYQSVELGSNSKNSLSYGFQGWVDTGTASGHLKLFQFDSSWKMLTHSSIEVRLSNNKEKQFIAKSAKYSNARYFIWAFYPQESNRVYRISNPWLTPE